LKLIGTWLPSTSPDEESPLAKRFIGNLLQIIKMKGAILMEKDSDQVYKTTLVDCETMCGIAACVMLKIARHKQLERFPSTCTNNTR